MEPGFEAGVVAVVVVTAIGLATVVGTPGPVLAVGENELAVAARGPDKHYHEDGFERLEGAVKDVDGVGGTAESRLRKELNDIAGQLQKSDSRLNRILRRCDYIPPK